VNDHVQYEFCKTHALDLLQGQFYTVTLANDNIKIPLSAQTLMTLLVKLQEPSVDPKDLAVTINKDLHLSYKLLRLINSAFFGLPREVNSIKHVIVMLGHKKIKTWASLLSLSTVDNKPNELRVFGMARARMCELLAKYYKAPAKLSFAAGLFSTLDALLNKALATVLSQLPLWKELSDGLLHKAGQALRDVLNYEKGDWLVLGASPLPVEIIAGSYLDAIHWAKELKTQLVD
jgi:c-di-GMP-related signal transduction protein